jgi:hypothetical protein
LNIRRIEDQAAVQLQLFDSLTCKLNSRNNLAVFQHNFGDFISRFLYQLSGNF